MAHIRKWLSHWSLFTPHRAIDWRSVAHALSLLMVRR